MTSPPGQLRALAEVFFARFFESESAAHRTDPTRSFLWLIGIVSGPGILFAFYRHFEWDWLARSKNVLALEATARSDISSYLLWTWVAVSVVGAARWPTVLLDGRDTLILGALPVRRPTILLAKLVALGRYTLLLAIGMHVGPSLLYGMGLGFVQTPTAATRTFVALFVASAGLTVFVMALVVTMQATGLLLMGSRRFARTSAALQMVFVGLVLLVSVWTPGQTELNSPEFAAAARSGGSPLDWSPTLWFLGIFEAVARRPDQDLLRFAGLGTVGFVGTCAVALVAFPLAGQFVLRSIVAAGPASPTRLKRIAAHVPKLLGREPAVRAAAQFGLASIGRAPMPRLILALTYAVAIAALVPVFSQLHAGAARQAVPGIPQLAYPFVILFFTLLGFRLAIKTPVELQGRWLFLLGDFSPLAGRTAVWRLLFAVVVLPSATLTLVIGLALSQPTLALGRAAVALAAGMFALEISLWGYVGMPCSRPSTADGFRGRWLAFLLGLELFCYETAAAQLRWQNDAGPLLAQAALFAVLAGSAHVAGRRAAQTHAVIDDDDAVVRLDLEVVRPAASPGTLPATATRRRL
jgi:hypothetical protein